MNNAISSMVTLLVTSQKEVTRPWQIRLLQCKPQEVMDLIMHFGLLFGGVHSGFLPRGALQGAGVQSDLAPWLPS